MEVPADSELGENKAGNESQKINKQACEVKGRRNISRKIGKRTLTG